MKEVPPSSSTHPANTAGRRSEADVPETGKPAWSDDIRSYYQAAAQEPVPQDFMDLMAQIAKQIKQ
ncbi:NepR family anti-sigma factor [Novosphingobium sp. KACC 22771]|uniref:NepR family anti-sigma factor n=1 Tax=Novosphingobium sp. KACC 22771 TaxID=3025670 RepID=UPI0023650AAF|nr:NepR family anti-sigma factor [Novosphingobium sp. KACC 22771]WDF73095.1 NepR family anti-sigma factor [Novosphingobium sp. KACC 22771]